MIRFVCLSVTLFLKPLYSTTFTFYRYTYKIYIFFKSRLCSYIHLDFLQFPFISSKKYILQIYLFNIKSFSLKNTIFCLKYFQKSSNLCSCINLVFLQFLLYLPKYTFINIFIKYKNLN